MKRVNDETISKLGCHRRKLQNGLLQVVSRSELSEQFKLFGGMVDRWARNKHVTFIPLMHGAGYTWQRLMAGMSEESQHIERVLVAQSYGDGQIAETVKIHGDWLVPKMDITGRDIVFIDDILDSGRTIRAAIEFVTRFKPRSIETFFMLRKECDRIDYDAFFEPTWVMFDIDDCWIVGAGLDDCGKFRHLRYIAEKPKSSRSSV